VSSSRHASNKPPPLRGARKGGSSIADLVTARPINFSPNFLFAEGTGIIIAPLSIAGEGSAEHEHAQDARHDDDRSCPVAGPGLDPKIQANVVYLNGRTYTLDSKSQVASAVAEWDGKFIAVGWTCGRA